MGKNRPLIGVTPLWDEEKKSLWMLPAYMECVRNAGGLPVLLPLASGEDEIRQLAQAFDGFLLTGGQDVQPGLYGQQPIAQCGETAAARDALERVLLREAMAMDKPVLGICRGIQMLNVALGGTLYQDLPSQHPSDVCHRQGKPYDRPVHDVAVQDGSALSSLLGGATRLAVNSFHHQAIDALAPILEAMACSPDGLVEAVREPGRRFVWAVQWHPEFCSDAAHSKALFRAFLEACEA